MLDPSQGFIDPWGKFGDWNYLVCAEKAQPCHMEIFSAGERAIPRDFSLPRKYFNLELKEEDRLPMLKIHVFDLRVILETLCPVALCAQARSEEDGMLSKHKLVRSTPMGVLQSHSFDKLVGHSIYDGGPEETESKDLSGFSSKRSNGSILSQGDGHGRDIFEKEILNEPPVKTGMTREKSNSFDGDGMTVNLHLTSIWLYQPQSFLRNLWPRTMPSLPFGKNPKDREVVIKTSIVFQPCHVKDCLSDIVENVPGGLHSRKACDEKPSRNQLLKYSFPANLSKHLVMNGRGKWSLRVASFNFDSHCIPAIRYQRVGKSTHFPRYYHSILPSLVHNVSANPE
ncbi:hypothetical protein Tco_1316735 [Tanacetum coccineum]